MMEELLSGLDDLPALMRKIQEQPEQVRKVHGVHASSHNVESLLKPDDDTVVAKKLADQAELLLGHLKHLKVNHELDKKAQASKTIAEAAEATLKGIRAADSNPFAPYDVCRRGEISYHDFAEITKAQRQNALSLRETQALARELDKSRTGMIKYRSIEESLRKLADAPPTRPAEADSVPFGYESNSRSAVAEDRELAERESAFFRALARRSEGPASSSAALDADAPVVSVKSLDPNYPKSIPSASLDPSSLGYSRGDASYYNSKLSAKETTMPVPESRSRGRSAPPPSFRGPLTQESVAANANRLRATWKDDFFDSAKKLEEAHMHEDHKKKNAQKEHINVDASRSSLLTYISEYGDPNAKHNARTRRRQAEQEAEERQLAVSKEYLAQKERTARRRRGEDVSEADKEYAMKTRNNSLIKQLNGNMKLLETQLNKMDPTRSGYVNVSEFEEALRRCNISMPRKEVTELFNNYAENSCEDKKNAAKSLNFNHPLVNVNNFVYKQRVRASAPWFASNLTDVNEIKELVGTAGVVPKTTRKHYADKQKHSIKVHGHAAQNVVGAMTDLERERLRVSMKVLRKHTDPGFANYRAKFANEVIPTGGMIEPEKLMEHLNTMGSTIGRNEFDVLVAPLPRLNGKLSLSQFEEMLHRDTFANHHGGDMGDLSIGINSATTRSNARKGSGNRGLAAAGDRNLEWDGDASIPKTQNAAMNTAAYPSEDDAHRRALRKNRINWAKVVENVQLNRKCLEKTIREMPELLDAPGMTPSQLGHLLQTSGIRLGRDDIGLIDSHCRALRSKQQAGQMDAVGGVTVEALCDSLGLRISQDAQQRPILLCPDHEASQDNGVFFTTHCPVVSNNTFFTSMAESGPWDMKWNTMKRHFNDRSAPRPASEYWNLDRSDTFDLMPTEPGARGENKPWGQRWPLNDTAPRGKNADVETRDVRPMYSPFGRGRDADSVMSSGGTQRTPRSRSAPPGMRSLHEVISSTGGRGTKGSFNPSGTYGSTTSASTFGAGADPSNFSDEGSTNSASQRSLRSFAESVQRQARSSTGGGQAAAPETTREVPMRDVTAAMSKWTSKPLANMLRDQYNQ